MVKIEINVKISLKTHLRVLFRRYSHTLIVKDKYLPTYKGECTGIT